MNAFQYTIMYIIGTVAICSMLGFPTIGWFIAIASTTFSWTMVGVVEIVSRVITALKQKSGGSAGG